MPVKKKVSAKKTATAKKKSAPTGKPKLLISPSMTIGELAGKYPQAVPVLFAHGLHCIGCGVAAFETIEQGAMAHGIVGKQFEKMLADLNAAAKMKA